MKRLSSLILLLPLVLLVGCSEAKIPLFNPLASPVNRLASAREVNTEVNNKIADFVAKGWITQETVNKDFAPFLDPIPKEEDAVEAFLKANKPASAVSKLDSIAISLRQIRGALAAIQRSRR